MLIHIIYYRNRRRFELEARTQELIGRIISCKVEEIVKDSSMWFIQWQRKVENIHVLPRRYWMSVPDENDSFFFWVHRTE